MEVLHIAPENCIISNSQQGSTPMQKEVLLCVNLSENHPSSLLIYYLSKQFHNMFKVWMASLYYSMMLIL